MNQSDHTAGNDQNSGLGEESSGQYLTFLVNGERFAIEILDVKELIEVDKMTRVPMTPDYIRGVINLRGNAVAIVDLCARLGKDNCELTKRSSIVLVEVERHGLSRQLGMLVDEVNEILEIPQSRLRSAPDFGSDIQTAFIQAMGEVDGQFMILLDINHVLSKDELSEIDLLSQHMEEESN